MINDNVVEPKPMIGASRIAAPAPNTPATTKLVNSTARVDNPPAAAGLGVSATAEVDKPNSVLE